MKTNVSIVLDDHQLTYLADRIDGKGTKRKATRKEVTAICQQHIAGLVAASSHKPCDDFPIEIARTKSDLYVVDPADRALMSQPDNPGYVRGWNLAKRGAA